MKSTIGKEVIALFLFLFVFIKNAHSDIVKPALVEISVYSKGYYVIEIRASIEAMLTGINSQYKTTNESPNADKYDILRQMLPEQLAQKFRVFKPQFLESIKIKIDNKLSNFTIKSVTIPEAGYTKVPRTSVITLTGSINPDAEQIHWYYPARYADNAVRVRQVDQENEQWHWSNWQWLRNDKWSDPFSLKEVFHKQSIWQIIKTYTLAGFDHIIPKGTDHLLFIIGIFLMCVKLRPIITQITMFTLAHSFTLSLSMLNIITVPASIVEPLIALSIAYIGIENIITKKIKISRLLLVFIFGLLHGLGFASILSDFGMPQNNFAIALISFNVGVELAQIAVIFFSYFLITNRINHKKWYRKIFVIPVSVVISLIGIYWTYDRIAF